MQPNLSRRRRYGTRAAPWVRDGRIRQAVMHMIDRQTLAVVFEPGGSAPADMYVALNDPAYHLAEQRGFATTSFRRGVRGPGGQVAPSQPITTWNVHEWAMDR